MEWAAAIKVIAMIVMFIMIMVVGSLPIRLKSFKTNPLLLSLTRAFSGGLFLGVGVIHLLPEANEKFEAYAEEQGKTGEQFPFAFLILVLSFSLILFIEKIATDHHNHDKGETKDEQKERFNKDVSFTGQIITKRRATMMPAVKGGQETEMPLIENVEVEDLQ